MRIVLFAVFLALVGCHNPVPETDKPAPKAKAGDLDALASLRASSDGAAIEQAQADARSEAADKVYASGEGEAALVELQDDKGNAPASLGLTTTKKEFSGPTDLDKASESTRADVDMDAVSAAIRSNQRRLNGCWEDVGPGGSGTVLMRITIGVGGSAAAKLASSSKVRNPELARCLASALERTDFPSPSGGAVSFEYPLRF